MLINMESSVAKFGRKFTLVLLGIEMGFFASTMAVIVVIVGGKDISADVVAITGGFMNFLLIAIPIYAGADAANTWSTKHKMAPTTTGSQVAQPTQPTPRQSGLVQGPPDSGDVS